MKRWIGIWLMTIAVAHTLVGSIVFFRPLQDIILDGVYNAVGGDFARKTAVWFLTVGFLLFLFGAVIDYLERQKFKFNSRSIGLVFFIISATGVILIPNSGFWLLLPPAIGLILRGTRVSPQKGY